MQKAIKTFLGRTKLQKKRSPDAAAQIILDFWTAVALVMSESWIKPRRHLVTKGIGVYALMELAADLCIEATVGTALDKRYFAAALADFATEFDWTTEGPLKGLGGKGGVKAAVALIREARRRTRFKVIVNG